MIKILSISVFLLFTSFLQSQSKEDSLEMGYYSIKNYSNEEYKAHYQNWSITQDKNGLIYAANGDGVLEFDGVSWRLITSPGLKAVRTVVVDDDNVKWVGGDRELGYLEPDSFGTLQYVSLKDKIPKNNPLTSNIWRIFVENDRIIFAADNELYSLKNGHFSIIPHPGPGPIYREYQINDKVYVRITGEGMFEVVGNTLQLIPFGEYFKNVRATVAVPYDRARFFLRVTGRGSTFMTVRLL